MCSVASYLSDPSMLFCGAGVAHAYVCVTFDQLLSLSGGLPADISSGSDGQCGTGGLGEGGQAVCLDDSIQPREPRPGSASLPGLQPYKTMGRNEVSVDTRLRTAAEAAPLSIHMSTRKGCI